MEQAAKKQTQITGQDLQGNSVEELQTSPSQLSLFQDAFTPGSSSTIEMYDAMPKHFASTKEMEALRRDRGGQFLETLKKKFQHRGSTYELEIRPARVNSKDGIEREYYPTEREHLIEQALRKIAINPLNGIYLGGQFAVQFSISELRRELKRTGHEMTYQSLIEGLKICSATQLTLATADGENVINSAIFPMLMLAGRKQWEKNPSSTRCYVKFHPLVTVSVDNLTYRQMNYEKFMSLDRSLSRYLFKRLSHLYRQASFDNPYHIGLSTLIRDSGMMPSPNNSDNAKRVERALNELKTKGVLSTWARDDERGPHNRIINIIYNLYPSMDFKNDIVRANKRASRLEHMAQQSQLVGTGSPGA